MAKNKEDNRWRNLILIIVVIAVIALAVIYGLGLIQPSAGKATLEDGYSEIKSIFESNDIDMDDVRLVLILSVDDSGNVVQGVSNEKLAEVSSELDTFISQADSKYSEEDSEELKDVATILKGSLEYSANKSLLLDDLEEANLSSFDCAQSSRLVDLNTAVEDSFYELADLVIYSQEFNEAYGYDETDEIILVDLEFQAAETEMFNQYITDIYNSCEGIA